MPQPEISAGIRSEFPWTPTADQEDAIERLAAFLSSPGSREVFLLKGYAGTGKTTLISALIRYLGRLEVPCTLMAPTGRAAKVMTSMSGHEAGTIHKKIYRQQVVDGGFEGFQLSDNKDSHTLYIVDEASMISNHSEERSMFGSGRLLDDLIRYVYNGHHCRLILMGDTAQLPPVGTDLSPAMDSEFLRGYHLNVTTIELRDVVRQAGDSSLLGNATALRRQITENRVTELPRLSVNGVDVIRLQGEDLVEQMSESYRLVGEDQCKVVCRSNRRAVLFNQGIRSGILWLEEQVATGDILLVARNNYLWSEPYKEIPFIANGDLLEVVRVRRHYEMYGFHFADMLLRFHDMDWEIEARVLLECLQSDAPALDGESRQRLYEAVVADYGFCHSKKELYEHLRRDPWLNALQVKYGYALTCHKAQGGQWKHIYLDQGYVTSEMMGLEYYRWLYTALTRATEKLYLVNFRDEFIAS